MSREHRHLTDVADADALAKAPADRLLKRINQASGRLAVCLSGGSTPEGLYALLATELYCSTVPWNCVHWFWETTASCRRTIRAAMPGWRAACCSIGSKHRPATFMRYRRAPEVRRRPRVLYEADLRRFYGAERLDFSCPLFAMVLMGLGAYGHTASLFPDYAELDETERWVVGVDEAGLKPFVPRVTLTFPVLASTCEMLFLVSGTGKREILKRVLSGADLPAARAYAEVDVVWLVHREAAPEHRYVA
jgi:6-phosphogluconolactonase